MVLWSRYRRVPSRRWIRAEVLVLGPGSSGMGVGVAAPVKAGREGERRKGKANISWLAWGVEVGVGLVPCAMRCTG